MIHESNTSRESAWSPYDGCTGLLQLKGSLHNHTVSSSGRVTSPAEIRRIYQDAGFHFAAVTDHDRRLDQLPWAEHDYEVGEAGAFVLLRGYEASFPDDHVNCIGCLPRDLARTPGQEGFVSEVRRAGGIAFLNHPAKHSQRPERVFDDPEFRLMHGLEVYSGARVAKTPGAVATELWDACLASGLRLWAFASADCHNYDPKLPDGPFNGYVVVFAHAVEADAITAALKAGRFYGSTGVDVERVACAGGRIEVASSNADTITFVGARGPLRTVRGAAASYDIVGDEGYVRVELQRDEPCFDAPGAPPRSAWLQPMWP